MKAGIAGKGVRVRIVLRYYDISAGGEIEAHRYRGPHCQPQELSRIGFDKSASLQRTAKVA